MSDVRADDDDRLPWLEAVDEEEYEQGPSAAKLIAYVVIGLVALGLIVGGLFWWRASDEGSDVGADQTLIAAPEGDYKVKPDDPGGMQVDETDETALAASQGRTPEGRIDVAAVPEAPVTERPKAAGPAPAPAPAQTRAEPAARLRIVPMEDAPAAAGGTIQLGAFDSNAQATAAWKTMSGRFKYLEPLSHSVMTATVNGRTYYRLRASGPDARDVCRRLEVAGESCLVVN